MRRQTFHATFPDRISSNTSKDNACKVSGEHELQKEIADISKHQEIRAHSFKYTHDYFRGFLKVECKR